jgi:hypothetical protein
MAGPAIRPAYSQRPADIGCGTLAPRSRKGTVTLPATQTSAVATTTCLDYLHLHVRTRCPSTALPAYIYGPLRRLPTGIGCGALAPRSQTRHTQAHHNFGYTSTLTAEKLRTCISWRLSLDGAHLHARHRPRRCTTSNGYWVCVASCPSLPDHTWQHPLLATQTTRLK